MSCWWAKKKCLSPMCLFFNFMFQPNGLVNGIVLTQVAYKQSNSTQKAVLETILILIRLTISTKSIFGGVFRRNERTTKTKQITGKHTQFCLLLVGPGGRLLPLLRIINVRILRWNPVTKSKCFRILSDGIVYRVSNRISIPFNTSATPLYAL